MDDGMKDEIRRLIHITFQGYSESSISSEMITRIWSLDFQWVDSMDAQKLLESLVNTGWLIIEGNMVQPAEYPHQIDVQIGWTPMIRRMLDGVSFVPNKSLNTELKKSDENIIKSITNVSDDSGKKQEFENQELTHSDDPMLLKIKEIRTHIANISGLEIREIQRRAQRKRRSCIPMTLWMALLLVGREQRIDVSSFL